MDDLGRLILEHGRYWFELVGGSNWPANLNIGLFTVAIVSPWLAILLAILALRGGGSE